MSLGLLVIIATVIAVAAKMLKQPTIIAYILCGIVAGPYFLNIMGSAAFAELFSDIGIAFLLFIVGLGLSPKVIREVGKISTITGVGQVLFTSLIGFGICLFMGFGQVEAAYIAVALAFSSTIIIVKLLTDKDDLETLYGRIAVGFLIVQDVIAIALLVFLSASSLGQESLLFETLVKGLLMIAAIFIFGHFAMPRITKAAAVSQDTLLLFAIGWCLALASLFHSQNFSMEIGALLAGVTLSMSPYRYEISARMRGLRDFFIVMFFVFLGSKLVFADVAGSLPFIAALSIFVLVGNPLIVMVLMGAMNYTKRNSFLAGLTVAQISEFSIIFVALGVKLGHVSAEILSIVTMVGLITIAGSTYMIYHSTGIYNRVSKYLGIFEKRGKKVDEHRHRGYKDYDAILFGYNRMGYGIAKSFKKIRKRLLIVDYNPETITELVKNSVDCVYGDASDPEFLEGLPLRDIKVIFSTIPDFEANILLVSKMRKANRNALVFVVCHQVDQALSLYGAGATYVILPHFLGGHYASRLIEMHGFKQAKFAEEKEKQIKRLLEIKSRGFEHPVHEKLR